MKWSLLLLTLALVSCGSSRDGPPSQDPAPAQHTLTVLFNAQAYTLDPDQPWVDAVVFRDGTIEFVGSSDAALAFAGEDAEIKDLAGQMLLPGFVDAHTHPIEGGAMIKALSLDTWGSIEGWVAAIDEYSRANPDAEVLFGYGFLASRFGLAGPHRELIDAVVPDRPVLIMDEGFHGAWANTRAMEKLNITRDTLDPTPGFDYYKRDENGKPTGYLLESTATMATAGLGVFNARAVTEGSATVIDIMNSYGVTAAFDAGVWSASDSLEQVVRDLEQGGDLTIRLIGSYRPDGPDDVATTIERTEAYRANLKGDRYHFKILKIMNDGTVEGRTAAMFEDYQGEPGNSGETVFSQDEMDQMVVAAASRNIDVHIHALGERAVHESLNAIETARRAHPDSESRFALCHIQVIADSDMERFRDLDVIAQSTPLWSSYDEYGKQFVSDDQFDRFWRFKGLRDLGVRLTFGSDFPSSGAGTLGMSPLIQMEIGHTRQEPGQADAPIQPLASERLDLETLIRGFTIDAAYQLRMEEQIGSLEVGKKADLVVLNQNLFAVDPYTIHKIEVVMTILDGEIVYQR